MSKCLKVDPEQIYFPGVTSSLPSPTFDPIDILCSICKHILCCPLNIPQCSHLFCSLCLQDWYKSSYNSKSSFNCPMCRAKLSNPNEYSVNSYLQTKIEQLQSRCMNFKEGCPFVVSLKNHRQELKSHLLQCEYQTFFCEFCRGEVIIRDKQLHWSKCDKYVQVCSYCYESFDYQGFERHKQEPNQCKGLLPCPNQCKETPTLGNGIIIEQDNISYLKKEDLLHHYKVCKKRKIECPVCKIEICINALDNHFASQLTDVKHLKHFSQLYEDDMVSAPLDETGVGHVIRQGEYRFFQQNNKKWVPVQVMQSQIGYTFKPVEGSNQSNTVDSNSIKFDYKESLSSSSAPYPYFLLEKCHYRILPFEEGIEKFFFTNQVKHTFKIGDRVSALRPFNTEMRGKITLIDQNQICIDNKEWFHQAQVQALSLTGAQNLPSYSHSSNFRSNQQKRKHQHQHSNVTRVV